MQIDTANIVMILASALVTVGSLILNFINYRGQNRVEDKRIDLDTKRLDQESSRTQTDATVQLTSAATSLTGVYSSYAEQLRTENSALKQEILELRSKEEEYEVLRARISDIGNYARLTLEQKVCPMSNETCLAQSDALIKMINRIEEQHAHISK